MAYLMTLLSSGLHYTTVKPSKKSILFPLGSLNSLVSVMFVNDVIDGPRQLET